MEKLLTMPEVAEITRTPLETVRYWRSTGAGPSDFPRGQKVGRRVLFRESEIREWLDRTFSA